MTKTYTNATEYLRQINFMRDEINFTKNKLQNLRELADDTSAALNPIKVRCSKEDNAKAIIIENMIDLENDLKDLLDEYCIFIKEVTSKISQIPNYNCKMVLFNRYIKNLTFDEIIYDIDLSRSSVFRLHNKGLKLLDDMM